MQVKLAKGTSQATVTKAIEAAVAELNLPPDCRTNFIGASSEFRKTFVNFGLAFLLSFIFMFLVISAQFESFLHAGVILLTLPLTVPFAMVSIILSGDSLNIFSMLGMLVLLGVVKKNAILQIDFANQLRANGYELQEAAIEAARVRLRPILMTTLAFVAGMLPLVLARGTGAATNRSTGGVILFGQVLSLLVTLVAAPVFYVMAERAAGWLRRRWLAVRGRGGAE
ncbi:MAG: efflux RND transporter permease subunit [Rubrivivax sp.]|nr:efflux RND transporter permease subunit [Rubrivivax sp.]